MKPLPDHAWCAWHPSDLQSRLQFRVGWYVVGGWALDLWHGAKTRDHEDLEFAVLPHDLATAQTLLGELDFFAVEDGASTFYLQPNNRRSRYASSGELTERQAAGELT